MWRLMIQRRQQQSPAVQSVRRRPVKDDQRPIDCRSVCALQGSLRTRRYSPPHFVCL